MRPPAVLRSGAPWAGVSMRAIVLWVAAALVAVALVLMLALGANHLNGGSGAGGRDDDGLVTETPRGRRAPLSQVAASVASVRPSDAGVGSDADGDATTERGVQGSSGADAARSDANADAMLAAILDDDAALSRIRRDGVAHFATDAVASCALATNCLQCLYRTGPRAGGESPRCVWLASRERCVDEAVAPPGADTERDACPAVLFRRVGDGAGALPSAINVIHVAIRKGGPEALVQLHLALAHWGFRTHLDTRRSKRQKGGPVVPFFREMYAAEFARTAPDQFRTFADYDQWQRQGREGDVLVATETWPCTNDRTAGPFDRRRGIGSGAGDGVPAAVDKAGAALLTEPRELRARGVRYAQWHLTVWPRKARSGCTIMAHTRYIAEVFMRAPLLSLLFPYVSPHIVRLALATPRAELERRKAVGAAGQQPLLMFDGDVKADRSVFAFGGAVEVKKATGMTPQQLYGEYARASTCIDLELPGGERFIYESALFGCCAIVDRSLNGLDAEDFALPDALRVAPLRPVRELAAPLLVPDDRVLPGRSGASARRGRGLAAGSELAKAPTLSDAIARCIHHRADAMRSLEPLRRSVLRQRVRFHRHVRRYFSNSVHVVTAVATAAEFEAHVPRFLAATLAALPFATVEFVVAPSAVAGATRVEAKLRTLLDDSYLAAVLWTVWDAPAAQPEVAGGGAAASASSSLRMLAHVAADAATVVSTSPARAAYVAFVAVDCIVQDPSFVHHLASVLALRAAHPAAAASAASSSPAGAAPAPVLLLHDGFAFADTRSLFDRGARRFVCGSVSNSERAAAPCQPSGSLSACVRAVVVETGRCDGTAPPSRAVALVEAADAEATHIVDARRRVAGALVACGDHAVRVEWLTFLCRHEVFRSVASANTCP
jgi:hypothetical protein